MNDFEKAVRYLVLFETDDDDAKINRYDMIFECARDEIECKRLAEKYEKVLNMLCS